MQRKITVHRIGETMERIKKKLVLEDGSVFEGEISVSYPVNALFNAFREQVRE